MEKKFLEEKNDYILVYLHVKPNSKNQNVEIAGDKIIVNIQSPPIGGKANKELIKLLSKLLKIPKSSISILKGEKSRDKIVRIEKTKEINIDKILDALR